MKFGNRVMLLLAAAVLLFSANSFATGNDATFAASEMLVKFKIGKEQKGNEEIRKIGAKIKERLGTIDVSRLKLPKGLTVNKAVKTLSKSNVVEFAEPNFIQRPVWTPSDTSYDKQWGLKKINAASGWGIHTGRQSTIIAIIDTGVDLDHPDLQSKLVQGYDFVDNDKTPDDDGGHGTHCAGIAAASSNNKRGVAGVCPNCSIMPIRTLGPDGGIASDTAKGIIYAADHGAKVISMSLGTYQLSSTIQDAVSYADGKGVLIVAAAGNDNVSTPHYPAYFNQCIAVGSTGPSDAQSDFSNYGAWVDVAAPGENILSTIPGGKYDPKWGTSMATPHVAGLAGLMFSCPKATSTRIKQAIYNSGHPVGSWVTHGRIDVAAALKYLGCGQSDSGSSSKTPSTGGTKAPQDSGGTPSGGAASDDAGTSVHLTQGQSLKAPSGALSKSDDTRVTVSSKGAGLQNSLDFYIETTFKGSTSGGLTIALEATSENPGTFEISLYDWQKGALTQIGTISVGTGDQSFGLTAQDASNYVNNKKKIRIRFYRKEKLWNGFDIGVDHLSLKAGGSSSKKTPKPPEAKTPQKAPSQTPEKEGNQDSVGDKAKKAWEKLKKKW